MLGVCATLLLVILVEVLLLGGESSAAAAAGNTQTDGSATSAAVPQSLQIPPVIAYREVTERPLFSDTRRPAPKVKSPGSGVAQAAQLASKWKVTGIVVAGDSSFALVEGLRDRKTMRLQLGMPLDGWKLEEIHPDRLEFSAAEATTTLQLHAEKVTKGRQRR